VNYTFNITFYLEGKEAQNGGEKLSLKLRGDLHPKTGQKLRPILIPDLGDRSHCCWHQFIPCVFVFADVWLWRHVWLCLMWAFMGKCFRRHLFLWVIRCINYFTLFQLHH